MTVWKIKKKVSFFYTSFCLIVKMQMVSSVKNVFTVMLLIIMLVIIRVLLLLLYKKTLRGMMLECNFTIIYLFFVRLISTVYLYIYTNMHHILLRISCHISGDIIWNGESDLCYITAPLFCTSTLLRVVYGRTLSR